MNLELVLDAQAVIAESPTWVAPENALYWIDIKAPALHRLVPASGAKDSWKLPSDIGGFALDGKGRALVALRTGLYWLDLKSAELALELRAPFDSRLIRFNEAACDSFGRFWIGTMTDKLEPAEANPKAALYSYTPPGGLVAHPDFAFVMNGMAWNADETLFYLSHSEEKIIYQYPYDREHGALGLKREFARVKASPGVPDGAAMDVEGGYWCAIHGGGCLHRYLSSGRLDRIVELPVSQPTMCCFAGEQLDDLYVTSAREKLDAERLAHEPHAGGLFRFKPGIRGQPKCWRLAPEPM